MKNTVLLFDYDYQPDCYEYDEMEIIESMKSVQSKPQFTEIEIEIDDLLF